MNFRSDANVRTDPNIRAEAEPSVQSQYSASPVILALVSGFAANIDPSPDMSLFYHNIVNIHTARGWGLDNWGRILGAGRVIQVSSDDVLGFSGSLLQPFNRGVFANNGASTAYSLPDRDYRSLLLFKALANISSCDLATINSMLSLLFPKGAYVVETGVMAIRYIFEIPLEPWQRALFRSYGVLTKGAGVLYEWYEIDSAQTFGFSGSGFQPFDQGVFSPGLPVRPVASRQS